jgi:hypothetical protein
MSTWTMNKFNLILLAAIVTAGGIALWAEGYISLVTRHFIIFGLVMGAAAFTTAALWLTRQRLIAFALVAGSGGYITQYVGATLGGIWSYPPPNHTFMYVPSTFVVASLAAFGLSSRFVGPALQGLIQTTSRTVNIVIVAVLIVSLVLLTAPYRPGQGAPFWIYYGMMMAVAFYGAMRMDTAELLAVFVCGAAVGTCAEIMGARSGLWTFAHNPSWLPPLWLAITSWPLEVMTHVTISGLIARERLLP